MKRFLQSFGFLHSLNTALNTLFSFVQIIIFAHVLPPQVYSKVVVLTAVGFFLKPLDQAIGRANFIALREGAVLGTQTGRRADLVVFLYGQAALLVLASLVLPLWIEGSVHHYTQDVFYLLFALFTNFWALDLQTTAWSVDLPKEFVRIALALRITCFVSLAVLWATRDFLLFSMLVTSIMFCYIGLVVRLFAKRSSVLSPRLRLRDVSWPALRAHAHLVWTSLLTTLSELIVLNSSYAMISAVYGVGAAIVAFDSIIKIVRLAMNGSRTLAEIALPRHSRLAIQQDRTGSTRLFMLVLLVSVAATMVPALALAIAGPKIFALMLGPNNVMPASVGLVAGVIVLISGVYQPVLFFLGFANARREIHQITIASIIGFAIFSAIVAGLHLGLIEMLWAYAAYFGVASALATLLLNGLEGYLPSMSRARASAS